MQPSAPKAQATSQWSEASDQADGLASRRHHPVTSSGLGIAKPCYVTESSSSSDDRQSWPSGSSRIDARTPPSSSSSPESSSDSRDVPPALVPLHRSSSAASSSRGSSVSFLEAPSRLTLSAFRRPERAIRLTQSDPRRRISDEYDLYGPGCRVLGHGAFSTVRLALRRSDGGQVAVKTIAKHEALRSRRLRVSGRRYLEEWEILRKFERHPNVANLIDVFENDDEIQLVLEYCRGGELFDAIRGRSASNGGLTEEQAAQVTVQVLNALSAMHSQGIVHRDVKTENILLVSPAFESGSCGGAADALHVKLCDFGMARALFHENEDSSSSSEGDDSPVSPGIGRSYSIVGSNYYMAPEVGDGEGYSTAIDLYSLGVTLYILLCGFPPVFSSTSDPPGVVFPANVSDPAKSLVEKLLHAHADVRITAQEALKDPWIQQHAPAATSVKTSCATLPAPPPSRVSPPVPDAAHSLELVRHRLYQSFGKRARCLSASSSKAPTVPSVLPSVRPHKRQRRRSSSCLLALADLYRDVAAPTAFSLADAAAAAAAGGGGAPSSSANRAVVVPPPVVAAVVVAEGRPGGSRAPALPVL